MTLGRIAVCVMLVSLVGCGPQLANVSGTATFDGKPIEEGAITFAPVDGLGEVAGGPIENGRYIVSDLTPGKKVVTVVAVKKINFATSTAELAERHAAASKQGNTSGLVDPADLIPPDAEGNNREVELKAGSQSIDFPLKTRGK